MVHGSVPDAARDSSIRKESLADRVDAARGPAAGRIALAERFIARGVRRRGPTGIVVEGAALTVCSLEDGAGASIVRLGARGFEGSGSIGGHTPSQVDTRTKADHQDR